MVASCPMMTTPGESTLDVSDQPAISGRTSGERANRRGNSELALVNDLKLLSSVVGKLDVLGEIEQQARQRVDFRLIVIWSQIDTRGEGP